MLCMQIRSPKSVQLMGHQELFFWPKVLTTQLHCRCINLPC